MMKPCCVLTQPRKEQLKLDAHPKLPGLALAHELGNRVVWQRKGLCFLGKRGRLVQESTTLGQHALPGLGWVYQVQAARKL